MAAAHIIFGFTEGQWHGKKMRRILREHGHHMVRSIAEADFVIAHSGGCFEIPPLQQHQLLMLINPPYWPEKPLGQRGLKMIQQMAGAIRPGNEPFYHLHKTARNLAYLVRHQKTNRDMMRRASSFNLEAEVKHTNTILVRNSNDPWLTPQLDQLQKLNSHLHIKRLGGDHDNCWAYPEQYIELLESYDVTLKL